MTIGFYGGEPLLYSDDCLQIYKTVKENCPNKKFRFQLITNGTIPLTNILEIEDLYVSLSIDGKKERHDSNRVTSQGTGSWDIVMDNIQNLKSLNIPFDVICTADNEENLADEVIGLFELGASQIRSFVPRCGQASEIDYFKLENEYKKIVDYLVDNRDKIYTNFGKYKLNDTQELEFFKKNFVNNLPLFSCYSMTGRLYVQTNGDLTICSSLNNSQEIIGNIADPNNLNERLVKKFDLAALPECRNCKIKPGCRRCVYKDYEQTGSFFKCGKETKMMANAIYSSLEYLFSKI
jgi:uncharacterized protein